MTNRVKQQWACVAWAALACIFAFAMPGCSSQQGPVPFAVSGKGTTKLITHGSTYEPRSAEFMYKSQRCDQPSVVCNDAEWEAFEQNEAAMQASRDRASQNRVRALNNMTARINNESGPESSARAALGASSSIASFTTSRGSSGSYTIGNVDEEGVARCNAFNSQEAARAAREHRAPMVRDCSQFDARMTFTGTAPVAAGGSFDGSAPVSEDSGYRNSAENPNEWRATTPNGHTVQMQWDGVGPNPFSGDFAWDCRHAYENDNKCEMVVR